MEKFACIPVLGPKVTYLQSGRYIKIVGAYYFFSAFIKFSKVVRARITILLYWIVSEKNVLVLHVYILCFGIYYY